MRLSNFRAFAAFTITFGDGAYLVGPNNAGKSTLLTALRTANVLLRHAYRRKADLVMVDSDISYHAYPVSLREFPALRDSLRHEFGSEETRMELTWTNGSRMVAVWPEGDDFEPTDSFFYLLQGSGFPIRSPQDARKYFPELGVIPVLGPVEHTEDLLNADYINQNISGRLSSRHFRNQIRLLQSDGQFQIFLDWAAQWLGEISIDSVQSSMTSSGMHLQVYYLEEGSRVPKELVWAGDGVQVWLQLLYHVYRLKECETIILDEPEVYLHPDLQRRLVSLLESLNTQIILATHSSEMLVESDSRLTVLIDKSRKVARRPKSEAEYEALTAALGTAFNLRLARALRSKVAVFVEGNDMVVLKRFAKTLGLTALEAEANVTVVPLKGYSHWGKVEPFAWLMSEILPNALRSYVILDRDYRTQEACSAVEAQFAAAQVDVHIWKRKELESYLLTPSVISRVSGAPEPGDS